jgi:hypothetical protein
MRSRLAVVALVCALIALGVLLVVWQVPQRPGAQPRTAAYRAPRDEKRPHEHKPAFASVAAHHETTDSDDLLFVSSLAKALGDSETNGDSEPHAIARIGELARRAQPPAEVRTEARSFTAVADANRFLQERQFRCQIGGEDFQEGQSPNNCAGRPEIRR